jgi:pimeloyl-ACP methyl ester carboxylesterase
MRHDFVERHATSADGTEITYYVAGRGPRTWVAAPAMGAPLVAMRRLYEALFDECRVITWDMRGFHRSGAPAGDRAYEIPRHVEDLDAVVAAERLDRFVLGGWSMGVPISIEYTARAPSKVEALVLINGPFSRALDHAVPLPGVGSVVTRAIDLLGDPVGRAMNPLSLRLLGIRGVGRALERVGVVAREGEHFERILDDFRKVDWARYLRVIRSLHEYDGLPHLGAIRVPTLITAGSRDPMTPPRSAEHLQRLVAGSELFVVAGGTHYTPAEFPELVAERIRRFFAERLSPPAPDDARPSEPRPDERHGA